MRKPPFGVERIHFLGIGGIGMSGIAELMHNLGYRVEGCDQREGPHVARLRGLGIPVAIGHAAEHVESVDAVVISSAVSEDNPEVAAARAAHVPVVRRAEMLAELMRLKYTVAVAGSHGKTTTASLCAAVMEAGGFDPTAVIGGIVNAYGSNARLGAGEWMVVETDESDGSFVKLPATIAVVTNIDPEHLDHYGDFEAEKAAFRAFVAHVPFYGAAVLCIDHPEVQALIPHLGDRRVVTYGFSPQADIRAEDLRVEDAAMLFTVVLRARNEPERRVGDVRLAMPGRHNVQNALAAIAIADLLGIPEAVWRRALAEFAGIHRRFSVVGETGGVTVIDDYAHHPVEIAAVLKAARECWPARRIQAVVQPHRFTRLQALFEEFCTAFNDADRVVVLPVYAAGEPPIAGMTHEALAEGIRRHGHRAVAVATGPRDLPTVLGADLAAGDVVVCLGAGSISQWAQALPAALAQRAEEGKEKTG